MGDRGGGPARLDRRRARATSTPTARRRGPTPRRQSARAPVRTAPRRRCVAHPTRPAPGRHSEPVGGIGPGPRATRGPQGRGCGGRSGRRRAGATCQALAPWSRCRGARRRSAARSEEHTSELQSRPHLVCRLLLEKKKKKTTKNKRKKQKKK